MIKQLFYGFGLLALLSSFWGCNSNDPDPCLNAKPFEASFYIKEGVGDTAVATDNILVYSGVSFVAADDYDSYQWRIGNDSNVSYEKSFGLLFIEPENNIEVRLIAKKAATACFPEQIDTVYRTFNVIQWKDAAIIGRYVGHYGRTPNVKDTVEIRYEATAESPEPFGQFSVINIVKGCNLNAAYNYSCASHNRGNRAFALVSSGTLCEECPYPLGIIRLIGNDSLYAYVSYGDVSKWPNFPLPTLRDKFTGKRIK